MPPSDLPPLPAFPPAPAVAPFPPIPAIASACASRSPLLVPPEPASVPALVWSPRVSALASFASIPSSPIEQRVVPTQTNAVPMRDHANLSSLRFIAFLPSRATSHHLETRCVAFLARTGTLQGPVHHVRSRDHRS